MPIDIDSQEAHIIRKMVPFSTMPNNIFKVICNKIIVENARSGTFLFKRGDTKNELIYLLKGEISLEVDKLKMEVIKAGTESARFAIAHQLPRKTHAIAKGTVRFARLNVIFINPPEPEELEKIEEDKKEEVKTVSESDSQDTGDCIATLLMIPIIRTLPPANMRKIADVLEEVSYSKDETIIRQGDEGDYYYLIKDGQCLVTHRSSENSKEIKVAKLQAWDTFGEAALISGEPRSESVVALSEISLLRIKKDKFIELIKEPALEYVNYTEMDMMLAQGAELLDVRSPDEYEALHLEYAINAPLYNLRTFLKTLDVDKEFVVCCLDGKTSESAAFLLLTHKFSVKILKGGIQTAPKEALKRAKQVAANTKVHEDVVFGKTETTPAKSKEDLLAAENAKLRWMIKELKARCEKVEKEKSELEKKFRQLYKQSERLKQLLGSLKK